jgi:alkylhydroperoxidase family enzyme
MGTIERGSISFDIAAREAHVVGEGQRIRELGADEVDQASLDLINYVRAGANAKPVGADAVPGYMRTMMKHPEIFKCQMEMGAVIFRGRIPPREREIAVLRCGWLCRAPFEWGEHVDIGQRYGLTKDEVERVTRGSSAPGWSDHDRAILRGVEELIGDQAMTDETWETLAKTWDEAQMLEFPMMVGQYVATAFVQNSMRTKLAEDNPGLSYR